jgi:hypothetical protein
MTLNEGLRESAIYSIHGLGVVFIKGKPRRGISMGVVKIDKAVPDWDTHAVQFGTPRVWDSEVDHEFRW